MVEWRATAPLRGHSQNNKGDSSSVSLSCPPQPPSGSGHTAASGSVRTAIQTWRVPFIVSGDAWLLLLSSCERTEEPGQEVQPGPNRWGCDFPSSGHRSYAYQLQAKRPLSILHLNLESCEFSHPSPPKWYYSRVCFFKGGNENLKRREHAGRSECELFWEQVLQPEQRPGKAYEVLCVFCRVQNWGSFWP